MLNVLDFFIMNSKLIRILWIFTAVINLMYALEVNYEGRGYTDVPEANIPLNVTCINIAKNKISTLEAEEFHSFGLLVSLDLSHNKISGINELAFQGLSSLDTLLLNDNHLTGMPPLGDIANSLKELNLKNNPNIETVDFSWISMTKLTTLKLDNTGLTSMPVSVSNVPDISTLHVQHNEIKYIPDGYFEPLHKLKYLYISGNIIQTLNPATLHVPSSLRQLRADSIGLTNLTEGSFEMLTGLEQLYLKNNFLTDFSVISLTRGKGFSSLKHLHLTKNTLDMIPSTEQISDSLQQLLVAEMTFGNISMNYFDDLTELTRLDLQKTGIERVPQFNHNMTKLEVLNLHQNRINFVPADYFTKLPSLTVFNLGYNRLQYFEIPSPGLGFLTKLHLNTNELKQFPKINSSIGSIERLYLQRNEIREISMKTVYGVSTPHMIAESLVELQLHNNHLSGAKIDDNLWPTMPRLKKLRIDNITLKSFPNLNSLKKLTELWAQRNSFESLGPISNVKESRNLNKIYLTRNNLSSIINFVQLAETATSSTLKVYLGNNKIKCDVDICWMKYMNSNDSCYLNTTVSGTLLEMYMGRCSFCNEHGRQINFLKIHMVDLGCGQGNLQLDFGPEIPLDHVNLYERLISMGSDSNLTSCFKMQSINNGELYRLRFTYTEDSVDVLPLTAKGHNLTCDKRDECMFLYKDVTDYRTTLYKLCLLQSQNITDNMDNCHYQCKCYNKVPCEIKVLVTEPRDRILCDIIPTGSDKFVK